MSANQHPAATPVEESDVVYVIGHKNPDTDAICAAYGYAELLQRTQMPEALAACCGGINPRTKWVLDRAGIAPPQLLMDVRPTAGTICTKTPVVARLNETFIEVYSRMSREGVRAVPVIDDERKVIGMLTFQDLLELLMHAPEDEGFTGAEARRVHTSLANVQLTLKADLLHGDRLNDEQDFILTVSASSTETVQDRLTRYPREELLVAVGDRPDVQRLVIEHKVRAVALTSGASISPELLDLAKKNGVSVLSSAVDTASTAQLIRCSRSIETAVHRDIKTYPAKAALSSFYKEAQQSRQVLFPVVNEVSGTIVGVFSKTELLNPPRQKLVLVDHNEFSQAVNGAKEAEIVQVIDHHRLGGNLVSSEPIRFINEPVGSTSTIVARTFQQHWIKPTKEAAVCLCAGIVSDTLNLTSPTTTDVDRELLPWLARIAELDIETFTRDFFSAGSMLKSWPAEEMIGLDRKEFDEQGWKITISQIEEVDVSAFDSRRDEIVEAMEALIKERGMDVGALLVTDITRHVSVLQMVGDENVCAAIDYPSRGNNSYRLDGVVSRKKQFFPYISRVLGRVGREH